MLVTVRNGAKAQQHAQDLVNALVKDHEQSAVIVSRGKSFQKTVAVAQLVKQALADKKVDFYQYNRVIEHEFDVEVSSTAVEGEGANDKESSSGPGPDPESVVVPATAKFEHKDPGFLLQIQLSLAPLQLGAGWTLQSAKPSKPKRQAKPKEDRPNKKQKKAR